MHAKSPNPSPGTPLSDLRDLSSLDRVALCSLWPRLMQTPVPRAMSQGLMRRFLAFEIQARAEGGLTRSDLDRLDRLSKGAPRTPSPTMAPGSRFLREWNGVTHVVERQGAGYEWNGKVYASLSAIAKEITGAHWSGPRFFGVTALGKAKARTSKQPRSATKEGAP